MPTATESVFDRAALGEARLFLRTAPPRIDTSRLMPLIEKVENVFVEEDKLMTSGLHSPAGIAAEIQKNSTHTFARLFVDASEKNYEYAAQSFQAKRQAIESGRHFKDVDGEWKDRPAPATDAASFLFRKEIRDRWRELDSVQQHELLIKAETNGDYAFVEALSEAPATLPLITAAQQRYLADIRWKRAGLAGTHQAEAEALAFERRVMDRVRKALRMDDPKK